MATNELAAILARRRAKAGGESEPSTPAIKPNLPQTSPSAASSIAERIARLKQQSAVASSSGDAAPAPRFNYPIPVSEPSDVLYTSSSSSDVSGTSTASQPVDISAVAAPQEAAGLRQASNKIQQLQGSLGINVNPFGRPGGPVNGGARKPAGYQRESIMRTGEEEYGHRQHAMGVAMPGLTGSAIPMPGLTKAGFRLPGMAVEGEQRSETQSAALDDSHATMNRVAGPKRRGPTRPPPGAFRIPTMAAPIIDTVEPSQVPVTQPAVILAAVAPAEMLEPKSLEAPTVVAPPATLAANMFPTPASEPPLHSAPVYAPVPTPAPVRAPTPAAATMQKLPEPELMPPMKPYELHDDPFAPVYDNPTEQNTYAPAGFPSALMANFSMDELVIDDQPKPKPAATSTTSLTSATSHFGASSGTPVPVSEPYSPPPAAPMETPVPAPAQVFATPAAVPERVPTPARVPAPAAPTPMPAPTPAPVFAPTPTPSAAASISAPEPVSTPAPSVVASTFAPAPEVVLTPTPSAYTPAPAPAFVPTPTPMPAATPTPVSTATTPSPAPASGSYLFGAAAAPASDGDSSESDWSDDDNGGQSLFGAPSKAEPAATAPPLVTPSLPTPEFHQSPAPTSASLFGSSTPVPAPAAPAPGFVQATPQTSIPPAPYSSLFGGAASSSSESDSDDEGGLFGAPSNRQASPTN